MAAASSTKGTTGNGVGVPVAVLPGTPKDFPIGEARLIELAQKLQETGTGLGDESLLASSFRFEFPVISLSKKDYLKAVSGFKIKDAFPDMKSNPYHWRVDPYEPNRVWFTVRTTATHTGPLKFGMSTYKATGRLVQGAPECMSYVFDDDGKCTSFTGGYIMDRRVGNTCKLGAMLGILKAIGARVPEPGSLTWSFFMLVQRSFAGINGFLQRILGKKEE